MQNALAVHVVELEPLYLGAVDESRMRGRQFPVGAPDGDAVGFVESFQRVPQNAAPFEARAVNRAAERIQNKQLEPLAHNVRNLFVL